MAGRCSECSESTACCFFSPQISLSLWRGAEQKMRRPLGTAWHVRTVDRLSSSSGCRTRKRVVETGGRALLIATRRIGPLLTYDAYDTLPRVSRCCYPTDV